MIFHFIRGFWTTDLNWLVVLYVVVVFSSSSSSAQRKAGNSFSLSFLARRAGGPLLSTHTDRAGALFLKINCYFLGLHWSGDKGIYLGHFHVAGRSRLFLLILLLSSRCCSLFFFFSLAIWHNSRETGHIEWEWEAHIRLESRVISTREIFIFYFSIK